MTFHENEKCPVCNEVFKPEDDVVVCPICGTPHHRACYKDLGHCANASRHKQGYEYNHGEEEAVKADEGASANDSNSINSLTCQSCGNELENNAGFCPSCGEYQENREFSDQSINELFEKRYDGEDIEGKKITDIIKVVGSNTSRFVARFRKNKKLSWNWGAFFFGPLYLLYRKMYKEGFFVFVINAIVSLYVNGAFSDKLLARQKISQTVYLTLVNGGAISEELTQKMLQANSDCLLADIILAASTIIISIGLGLLADWLYKKRVFSVIDNIDASLSDNPDANAKPIFVQVSSDTPKSKLRDLYLAKSGGTNMFLPLILLALNLFL